MSWRNDKPVTSDEVSEFPRLLTSQMTALRSALTKSMYWNENSGTSAGEPRLDTTAPGACRAHFGTASQVSATRSGDLMYVSNTSRLCGLTSASSHLLGSNLAVIHDPRSDGTVTDSCRWLVQNGVDNTARTNGETTTIVYGTTYGAVPRVQIAPQIPAGDQRHYTFALTDSRTTDFTVEASFVGNSASPEAGADGFHWRSVGTVAL